MSKYIDLNEATDLFEGIDATMTGGWVADTLEALPTIDIVHCKDCTFAKPTNTENVIQCTWLSGYTFRKDHYCSCGERIEE